MGHIDFFRLFVKGVHVIVAKFDAFLAAHAFLGVYGRKPRDQMARDSKVQTVLFF
jgi:hypothetical protein